MPTIIDEQGNEQTWKAVYFRYFVRYEDPFESLDAALGFLSHGEEEGTLSAKAVLGPDGEAVVPEEEIFDARYGYGRWAEDRRAQTMREIGGGA